MYENKITYKNTLYKYTQPVYLNGMDAPAILAFIPAYLIAKLLPLMSLAASMCLFGISLAAVVFLFTYKAFIRRVLLNGGGTMLKYHPEKYRAVPFASVIWILAILSFFCLLRFDTISGTSYPNKSFYVFTPMCTALTLIYVCFYWVVLYGSTPIKNAFRHTHQTTSPTTSYQYRSPEPVIVPKPKDPRFDERGFYKLNIKQRVFVDDESVKEAPKSVPKAVTTVEKKVQPQFGQQSRPDEREEFPTPKLKKDKHLNGIVDRKRRR